MIEVWKFPLKPDVCTVAMPAGAEILRVGSQGTQAFLWARVDTDAPDKVHTLVVVGTGHPAPAREDGRYIGTFDITMPGEPVLVFHVFEHNR